MTDLEWDNEDTKAFLIALASGLVTAILISVILVRKG